MDWALAEHHIPDSQFGFCPTRNTNQPLFILRHILATAKKEKMKVFTAFLDLLAAYDSIPREKLWWHLQKTTIFERYHPNHVHRMPLPSHWWRLRRWHPTEAWNWAALWVPFCTSFITMTNRFLTLQLYREVLPLPWIQFRSLTVITLMTLLSLQTRLKICSSNRTNFYD